MIQKNEIEQPVFKVKIKKSRDTLLFPYWVCVWKEGDFLNFESTVTMTLWGAKLAIKKLKKKILIPEYKVVYEE